MQEQVTTDRVLRGMGNVAYAIILAVMIGVAAYFVVPWSTFGSRTSVLADYAEARFAPKDGMPRYGLTAGTPVVVVKDLGPASESREVHVTVDGGPEEGRTKAILRHDLLPR